MAFFLLIQETPTKPTPLEPQAHTPLEETAPRTAPEMAPRTAPQTAPEKAPWTPPETAPRRLHLTPRWLPRRLPPPPNAKEGVEMYEVSMHVCKYIHTIILCIQLQSHTHTQTCIHTHTYTILTSLSLFTIGAHSTTSSSAPLVCGAEQLGRKAQFRRGEVLPVQYTCEFT